MLPVDQRKDWIKSRRNKRKTARGARLRRQVFRGFLLLSILTLGVFGFTYLPWSLSNSESEIVVKGNHFTSTEQIRKVVADALYTPVYKMNPKELETKVETLATINNAFVRRYAFPRPHVVVEVLEEQPWASLGSNPELPTDAVIAETGRIIPLKQFPHVMSPALKIYAAPGLKMKPVDVKQWATWVTFIEAQTKQPVQYVDMRKPFDVFVRTEQLALKIGIPDAALTQRLSRLTSIMPTLAQYNDALEYVDLALDNNIPLKIIKDKAVLEARAKQKAAAKEAAELAAAEAAEAAANQAHLVDAAKSANLANQPISANLANSARPADAANPAPAATRTNDSVRTAVVQRQTTAANRTSVANRTTAANRTHVATRADAENRTHVVNRENAENRTTAKNRSHASNQANADHRTNDENRTTAANRAAKRTKVANRANVANRTNAPAAADSANTPEAEHNPNSANPPAPSNPEVFTASPLY